MMVDRAWTGDEKLKPQEWERCLEVLHDSVEFAKQFNIPTLGDAAVRAMVIICDEYLSDRPRAFEILDRIGAKLPSHSNIYVDAHANLLLHDNRNAEALRLWDSVLPSWEIKPTSIDSSAVFAHRKAGIAAAGIKEFRLASDYFFKGVPKADAAGLRAIAVGLLADSALLGMASW